MTDAKSKIKPETHLILDQPTLKLPYELIRKNFKVAQTAVERDSTAIKNDLKNTVNSTVTLSLTPDEVIQNLDSMVARMQGLKRKLEACAEEDQRLRQNSIARVDHLAELYTIPSLEDVKYERWSRVRLNRLLSDYMLRNGYCNSAEALAKAKGIEQLVDSSAFVRMNIVRESLEEHRFTEALAWCADNKKELRKLDSKFEFMLRVQQYIELLRTEDMENMVEAVAYGKKYLKPQEEKYPALFQRISGMLAFGLKHDEYDVYDDLYDEKRWSELVALFIKTHNQILSIPEKPPLHIALAAGLSALKTPLCYSRHQSASAQSSSAPLPSSGCPICSRELNKLAVHFPYAHHTSSHVDPDAVLLPNYRVYGRHKLEEHARKVGLQKGLVKDLVTGEIFKVEEFRKVYLS